MRLVLMLSLLLSAGFSYGKCLLQSESGIIHEYQRKIVNKHSDFKLVPKKECYNNAPFLRVIINNEGKLEASVYTKEQDESKAVLAIYQSREKADSERKKNQFFKEFVEEQLVHVNGVCLSEEIQGAPVE